MLVFDTETTHLVLPSDAHIKEQPHIIEVGVIKLDKKFKEVARYSSLVNPGVLIDEEMHAKITGLKNDDLKNAPTFFEVFVPLATFFLGERVLVAHNAAFDMSVLLHDLSRINGQHAFPWPMRQFCSARWSEEKYGKRINLASLYEKVTGKPLEQTHRAVDDADALAQIVRKAKMVKE